MTDSKDHGMCEMLLLAQKQSTEKYQILQKVFKKCSYKSWKIHSVVSSLKTYSELSIKDHAPSGRAAKFWNDKNQNAKFQTIKELVETPVPENSCHRSDFHTELKNICFK